MFLFFDIETTGLDPEEDEILEIGAVAVLNNVVIGQMARAVEPGPSSRWRDKMNRYVRDMHTATGLLEVLEMGDGMPLERAEQELIEFCDILLPTELRGDRGIVIAGNSIQFDRSFVKAQLLCFEDLLHHRMLDCSTLKMFAKAHYPLMPERVPSADFVAHRALDDAYESYETFMHYSREFNPQRRPLRQQGTL